MRAPLAWIVAAAALVALALRAFADEPSAQFQLEGRPHVDVPFQLSLAVSGLEESPVPEQPTLVIPDATVTPLGATPNVSRSIQIFNGRRSETLQVTWVMRWRVEVHKEGRLAVPETTVSQGSKRATAPAGTVEVDRVPLADDMEFELVLPSRPLYVDEAVPVTLTWIYRRQPQNPTFAVPMASSDAFVVSAPAAADTRRTITLAAGTKDLHLPYAVDEVDAKGGKATRFRATFYATPRRAGAVEIPPSSVVAEIAVGRADFFGNAPTRLFRAADVKRTADLRTLPESGRPSTFGGAIGSQFSIAVTAGRSVVQLGEPVELSIAIRSDQPLDKLSLGRLDGEGRLPKDRFTVPGEEPTGRLSEEGRTKTFTVVAQVVGAATEIPAIAFSYFDPVKGVYSTIRSDPIALSVKGGSVIGASDVEAAKPREAARPSGPAFAEAFALVGADLALSNAGAKDDAPLSDGVVWILFALLHAIPLAVLVSAVWRSRTRDAREGRAEVRAAQRRVEELLSQAASRPARDVAGPLVAALRDLARVAGASPDDALLARIGTESFAPAAASQPLSAELRADADALLRRCAAAAKSGAAAVAAAALLLALTASPVFAAPEDDGRAVYQEAMSLTTNATARRAAFARAETLLGDAVRLAPDRPELLADWGNAALGAGDAATATLAYRRALSADAGNARARHNLAWLRSRLPDAFRPAGAGATDALLFFHAWPRPRRLLTAGAAFALAALLLVPWAGRRRRALATLALVPGAVWLAMIASLCFEDRHAADAVVTDDVVLRAADSAGAPAALSQPLPRGVEVAVLEERDAWARVRIANGTSGWVSSGAVRRIRQ